MNADAINFLRSEIVGVNQQVPTRNGKLPYINFDNAATTPPLKAVTQAMESFLPWYSSVHRGFGFKSQFSTELYNQIRTYITRFLGGSSKEYVTIFVKNATEALNKLSYRVPKDSTILTTKMEHHSNDLPWRTKHKTDFIRLTEDGALDLEDFEYKIRTARARGGISLVTLCGASNVTGLINPIYTIAEMAHHYGAKISVDGAQLVPHQPITLNNSIGKIDFISFSGHKMYAPYGSGVLIGERSFFTDGLPEYLGGGTVLSVSADNITLAPLPDRDEAGTPNLIGAFALAQAIRWLERNNFQKLSAYESNLTAYAYQQLRQLPEIIVYGPPPSKHPRVGVITFNIPGLAHGLTASALAYEAGIGVRHGCFCARPYVHHLLGLNKEQINYYEHLTKNGNKKDLPGLVRVSFGLYNTHQEVDYLIKVIKYIAENKAKIKKEYKINEKTGEYFPSNGAEPFIDKLKELLKDYF